MKQGYWKGFVSGLALTTLVLGLGISAGAAGRTIAVEGSPRIAIDGTAFTPRDAKGNAMECFTYNGATYVPLREFSKAVGVDAVYDAATGTEVLTTPYAYLPEGGVTIARAKELALSHAGVKAADAVFYEVKLTWSGGIPIYDVGFYSGRVKYDYDVNAQNGTILGWDHKQTENSYPADYITAARAKELALSHAGVKAANAAFDKVKLDWENGAPVYEVEFHTNKAAYDYDIAALDGSILKWDSKTLDGAAQTGYITAERAKELALSDAGVKAADATFVKVKLDWDDGRAEYEVKFYSGRMEYEYDIDAITGKVLSRDSEMDDDWYGYWGGHHGYDDDWDD